MKIKTVILLLCAIAISGGVSCVSVSKYGINHNRLAQKILLPIDTTDYMRSMNFPDSMECYYDIKDSVDYGFSQFGKVTEPVNYFIKRDVKTLLRSLDAMSLKRIYPDTIYDINYLPINTYRTNFDYCKNRSGIITIESGEHACLVAQAEDLIRLSFDTIAASNSPLSQIIKLNPEEIFNALLLSWNIDALEQYLKYALPKYISIHATRVIINGDSITDIQRLVITSAEVYRLGNNDDIDEECDTDDFINELECLETDSSKLRENKSSIQYLPNLNIPKSLPLIVPMRKDSIRLSN